MKFSRLLILAAAVFASVPALAQNPIAFVNSQQLQIPATGVDFNNLILAIDNVLNPLLPVVTPTNLTATGGISLRYGSAAGAPEITTYSTTGATSVNLKISPLGNGKIILFNSNITPNDTGILKIANNPSWVAAPGLATCPGGLRNAPTPNGSVSGTITGYLLIQDWKESVHAVPTC